MGWTLSRCRKKETRKELFESILPYGMEFRHLTKVLKIRCLLKEASRRQNEENEYLCDICWHAEQKNTTFYRFIITCWALRPDDFFLKIRYFWKRELLALTLLPWDVKTRKIIAVTCWTQKYVQDNISSVYHHMLRFKTIRLTHKDEQTIFIR